MSGIQWTDETPYYQDDQVTLYLGDCREIVPALNLTVRIPALSSSSTSDSGGRSEPFMTVTHPCDNLRSGG